MNIKLSATKREVGKKKSVTKQLRKNGLIPAVIYSAGETGITITLEKGEFQQQYKKSIGEVALFNISLDDQTFTTFIKERQIHPVSRETIHIDFIELHAGKEMTLKIPITYTGDAPGIKEGGNLDIIQRKIEITCLPKDIPEEIVVDLSNLTVGSAIHYGDINMPENVSASFSNETTLVTLNLPAGVEEEQEEVEE